MTIHQGDRRTDLSLSCDADGCPRTLRLGRGDTYLSGFPPVLSARVAWQTVGDQADNTHRCPDPRTDSAAKTRPLMPDG